MTQISIGIVSSETGDPAAAAAYDKALAIPPATGSRLSTVTMYRDELANGYNNSGRCSLARVMCRLGWLSARRSRSARIWPMPTPTSFSSGKELAKSYNYLGTYLPRQVT